MTSHYAGVNLQVVSEGFVDMPDPEMEKLVDVAEAPTPSWQPILRTKSFPLLLTCEEVCAIAPV
jgi:hypothetical protein